MSYSVSALEFATVGVSQMAEGLRLFRDLMGWQLDAQYPAPGELCQFWSLPARMSAQVAELSARGYPFGRLRLVEYSPAVRQCVRRDAAGEPDSATDVGPKALDFYIRPPIARVVAKLAAAGYAARSAPVYHQIGRTVSEEVLISGPDGLPMLFMIGHVHAATSLRPGSPEGEYSEIPTVSVIAADLARSRQFYNKLLGLSAVNDAETPAEYRDLVDDLTGVPRGTRVHFFNCAASGEASGKILVLHFFERTGQRLSGRMRPGHLGFSLLTHRVVGIQALCNALAQAGFEIRTPITRIGRDQRMLVQGPNEELFEFIEYG